MSSKKVKCPACKGLGEVKTIHWYVMNELGPNKVRDSGKEMTTVCFDCKGTGKVRKDYALQMLSEIITPDGEKFYLSSICNSFDSVCSDVADGHTPKEKFWPELTKSFYHDYRNVKKELSKLAAETSRKHYEKGWVDRVLAHLEERDADAI